MPESASLHRIRSWAETGTSSTARRLPSRAVPADRTADRTDLARRVYRTAHITGSFTLRSGATSNEYFDKYLFEADPVLLRDLAGELAGLIPAGIDGLAGLEMGGIPIVTML